MGKARAWAFVFVLSVGACALPDPHAVSGTAHEGAVMAPAFTVLAPADWRGNEWLGMPLGPDFEPLNNGGGTLFPYAGPPICRPVSDLSKEARVIRSGADLKMFARAFNVPIGGGIGYGASQEYGFYEAAEIVGECHLNEASAMLPAPPMARYYAAQVFYGHSYWLTLQGATEKVQAALDLSYHNVGVSIGDTLLRSQLTTKMGARGLRPLTGDAFFMPAEQIAKNYTPDDAPAPIRVEYREITSPSNPARQVRVAFSDLQIAGTGALLAWAGHCTYWSMKVDCTVNGMPQPSVKLLDATNVCGGRTSIASPALTITATDQDVIECAVSGEYSRGRDGGKPLGQTATGPILVGRVNPSASARFSPGQEAHTSYSLTWTMARTP